MHKVASLNGKIIAREEAVVSALSAAAMYGRGVFTTLAVYDGEPFLLEKHRRRLMGNAQRVGIDVSAVTGDTIERALFDLLKANSVSNGRARITLFDAGGSSLWMGRSDKQTDVLIITGDKRKAIDEPKLTISPFKLNSESPLAGIKSCNYLEHSISYEDAQRQGFNEAIRTNQRGEVVSACMANVFWLNEGRMFTPSIETGCIPGTTREYILENVECDQVFATLDEVVSADAVFIGSAGVGIRAVRSIDDKVFRSVEHDILQLLPPNKNTNVRELSHANIRADRSLKT